MDYLQPLVSFCLKLSYLPIGAKSIFSQKSAILFLDKISLRYFKSPIKAQKGTYLQCKIPTSGILIPLYTTIFPESQDNFPYMLSK